MILRSFWDDPWQDLAALRGEFDQMLSRMGGRANGSNVVRPPAAVEDRDDAVVMEFDLPGVRSDDLEVEVDGRTLSLRGHRSRGRRDLIFERVLTLPESLDMQTLAAELENGVLTVTIAKLEQARKRRIEIGGGADRKAIDVGEATQTAEIAA